MLNVAGIVFQSKIYGPGERTVIWFQGCSIRCEGCINPHLITFKENKLFSINELVKEIHNNLVTLLGGEPLDQKDIYDFLLELKKRDIDVILFTGYEWNAISDSHKKIIEKTCSLLISGPYIKKFSDNSLYLRGSSNQELIYFNKSKVIKTEKETYEIVFSNKIEIRGRVNQDIFDIIESHKR